MSEADPKTEIEQLSLLDVYYGRFDEDSSHPLFGLDGGSQWPEGRAFARMANPYAMARFAQVLCGFSRYLQGDRDAADATLHGGLPPEETGEALRSIAITILAITKVCPAILSETPVALDPEWNMHPYVAEEHQSRVIRHVLQEGGLIPKDPDTFEREFGKKG